MRVRLPSMSKMPPENLQALGQFFETVTKGPDFHGLEAKLATSSPDTQVVLKRMHGSEDVRVISTCQRISLVPPGRPAHTPFLGVTSGTVPGGDTFPHKRFVTKTSRARLHWDMGRQHPMGMENNKAWKRAIRHILNRRRSTNDNGGCLVVGPHEGPILTMGSNGETVFRLCQHHAKIWSDSDPCHDFALTGHTDALLVLSDWISTRNASA